MNIKIGKASFKDSSLNNFPITANGNAQISKAQSKFGGWAGYFTAGAGANPIGTKSWLTTSSPLLNGIGAYTVEAWVYLNPPDYYKTIYSTRVVNTGSSFGFTDLNELFAYSDATGGLFSGEVVPHSQWVHVAWTYDGTNFRMFIDGVKVYDETEQLSHGAASYIGRASIFPEPDYGEFFIGYMDDFRITNGIALYTSNFTPPISELTASSQTSLLLNMNAGSVIASKGGSGKTNQKKYIDLLPPNFISKVTLSGGTYGDGTYTRNSGGNTTFNGPNGWYIEVYNQKEFVSYVPDVFGGTPVYYSSDAGNTWVNEGNLDDEVVNPPPNGATENALSFLFDPIFYQKELQGGSITDHPTVYEPDPACLISERGYQVNNIIPNNDYSLLAIQSIIGAPQYTKKTQIKNNTLSYIKYSDNTDVEPKKLNKFYRNISSSQSNYFITPPVDNKEPLLKLKRDDNQSFAFLSSSSSTLNMFIRLQRPVQHKNPNNEMIVNEKRGIFCTAGNFRIGYRSPYYNITGRPSYKGVFNNFSFVFSFGQAGYRSPFNRPISMNLMTDYKFNFGEMYMLSMVWTQGEGWRIYINGELQTVALVPFNPLVNPTNRIEGAYKITLSDGTYNNGTYMGGFNSTILNGPDGKYIELSGPLSGGGIFGGDLYSFDPAHPSFPDYIYYSGDGGLSWSDDGNVSGAGTPPNGVLDGTIQFKKLYKTRRDEMPLGPGFYKKDGTVYPYTNTLYNIFGSSSDLSYLIFGKSALARGQMSFNHVKRKRYLNNLDIGVINSYNIALSQSQVLEIYNNFRYRYI